MSDNEAAKSPDDEYKKKLNRIKSKICYYKKKPQCGGVDAHKTNGTENDKEIIEKLETYRSILKLSEAKIKEFNRINKLIGRDEFNKDEFLNSIQI
ncbi:hypothetical protein TVAG_209270 [Trichomonas vaginalis G3]|uniref:Uncharacterized protein n=1 Tax=Trichomonas vaginalis (strain ATCC PRA-98 / G3) TaxID=412133 RepID=A2DVG9_TRIV3|nr:hypothetical protein TVAGG3_0911760 [Trichomonas vaginalis G3]XP_051075847.1 uncharacterized protein TVAGG3_1087050 [Trichomonas vaginalis G3]XP_051081912.1 hypothetical protein TVAGG3_0783360 [Trichomonas vaginalis G3]XP_051093668.1 hypothetical protein TVAGG3_0480620 [Trichomonas vaginalis G3]XP_051097487.1 hypothetical protein TVAGG3_0597470 [Trichomonas vaginalis G3]XP_051106924.1 hypothetical protein TVAGG3_0077590 [Trichomonas vaginalis G3]EAX72443.1 hypothetical protein TVAG_086800 |eukprot:XP_001285373.1 hypothetical protein [Trichomonas vaginalis G3]